MKEWFFSYFVSLGGGYLLPSSPRKDLGAVRSGTLACRRAVHSLQPRGWWPYPRDAPQTQQGCHTVRHSLVTAPCVASVLFLRWPVIFVCLHTLQWTGMECSPAAGASCQARRELRRTREGLSGRALDCRQGVTGYASRLLEFQKRRVLSHGQLACQSEAPARLEMAFRRA